jgi:hypothetical protein
MCGIVAGPGHAGACGWPQALCLTCYAEIRVRATGNGALDQAAASRWTHRQAVLVLGDRHTGRASTEDNAARRRLGDASPDVERALEVGGESYCRSLLPRSRYFPVKRGSRRSRNAPIPSAMSLVV